jgi:drug/metabolite transporter (DMT)-like permease
MNPSMNARAWALLIALSVLWGGSFFFVGIAVKELPPLTIVALRVGGAAAALALVVWATGARPALSWPLARQLAVMGLLNNLIPFTLLVWGQTRIASGLAAILNAFTPIATVVLAHVLTDDERLTAPRAIGALLGLAGTVVLVGREAVTGAGGALWAQLACLGATLSYALASIYGRRFKALGLSPLATATGQVSAAALMLLPVAAVADRPWTLPSPGPETWGAILGIALLSTALAYVLYFRILALAGATNLMLVTLLVPVSALALGVLVLDETLRPAHLAGFALIAAGLACIDGRLLRRMRPVRHAASPD